MVGELWAEAKERAYKRMKKDLEIGYLDKDIVDILEDFFSLPYAFTKSSCSGRVTAVDADFPWSRDGTIVFKVHRPISSEELIKILDKPTSKRLWLNVQGPIFHVVAKDLESAFKVLEMARKAGFKHSGILTANEEGWLVELTTGVRANLLLKVGDEVLVKPSDSLLKAVNEVLLQGKRRLEALRQALREAKGGLELAGPSEGALRLEGVAGQRGEDLGGQGDKTSEV
ncbi:tRNA(Phe) 7-((3-amino-3-carboxypropyl)-4-demethylwyosine(37)-N(4))-methyltransferase [Ignicoccus hospitalis]|uniref:tRNA(Phe) 7-((3-amino-3-carboxypropyl)-4-demethylwyosine(37)-N(4))-methyltransferase n=1 Tax=Ignicoccus hospitalis (strain KIN4/I / DSM 18386 / JCM 14125) TaxID=453591 RepID=A8ABC6_IGNH4|nr:hypothetical protein [Ignicoccus hospitalis]ABU82228.1 Protein of unknown function DUF207 [Ignicoccus hospitalis KIN4/I]HIH90165.1 hypothetical protein [Desulfurococcaceae archaeon]